MSRLFEHSIAYYPPLDGPAVRLSMADSHGGEHWRIVSARPGASLRAARTRAREAIEEHIARGLPPGEVGVVG